MSPIVKQHQRSLWEEFSAQVGDEAATQLTDSSSSSSVPSMIYRLDDNETLEEPSPTSDVGPGPYSPIWQTYPPPADTSAINFDLLSNSKLEKLFYAMNDAREAVMSPLMSMNPIMNATFEDGTSTIFAPILEDLSGSNTTPVVATLVMAISWDSYLSFLTGCHIDGTQYVLKNTCDQAFTLQVDKDGQLGNFRTGDHHDTFYEGMVQPVPLMTFLQSHFNSTTGKQACAYTLHLYPTQQMREEYKSPSAGIAAGVGLVSFIVIAIIYYLMDRHMQQKNRQIIKSVEKSNAIIASLFPSNVRDRRKLKTDFLLFSFTVC